MTFTMSLVVENTIIVTAHSLPARKAVVVSQSITEEDARAHVQIHLCALPSEREVLRRSQQLTRERPRDLLTFMLIFHQTKWPRPFWQ